MRLEEATWQEVDAFLKTGSEKFSSKGVLLPTGSTEQHGPMGSIGTDTICATAIAEEAAKRAGLYMAPPIGYAPAPFNMSFPGTISVTVSVFSALLTEFVLSLLKHGFDFVYILNGHGANVEVIDQLVEQSPPGESIQPFLVVLRRCQ